MDRDLTTVFSLESDRTDRLERFVADRLSEAGVWTTRRTSDGIQTVRVVRNDPDAVQVAGRIYEIDQTLRAFWLELTQSGTTRMAWTLHFDLVTRTRREERNALFLHDRPEELEWRTTLRGFADFRDVTAAGGG